MSGLPGALGLAVLTRLAGLLLLTLAGLVWSALLCWLAACVLPGGSP